MDLSKIFKRFKTKNPISQKPTASVFVDFEHWFISLDKLYHIKPKIKDWRDELAKKYELNDIIFFADFSNPSLRGEIQKIREITNFVVDTSNTGSFFKKDFTDFIMLDHIYQKAITSDTVDTFIIFTGDGHFNSVVQFLVNRCSKEVGIYGIKNAISNKLKASATWFIEVPASNEDIAEYYCPILDNLRRIEKARYKRIRPTFMRTVESVAKSNNVDEDIIKIALLQLIEKNYIHQTKERTGNKTINVLHTDWKSLRRDRVYL